MGRRLLRQLWPSLRAVQDQAEPYAAAWHQANEQALGGSGRLWVVLGDSMSQGIGAPAYDRGWVGQAHARLAAVGRSYRLINLSVSGGRIQDVIDHQLPVLDQLGLRPDLITVMIGSNDLVQPGGRRHLLRRLDHLLMQLPHGAVVADIFARPNIPPLLAPVLRYRAASRLLHRQAQQRGLKIADMGPAFALPWTGKLAADRFHPNERGYAAIAAAFMAAITDQ
ncbi:MAG TPA: SGNH/GDSL hydrolase family protein [Candidatus Saccharimonadia bacterium]|nr:SGNH/GDSL hydrolase family protein [Candidatus Saccharimonadia bacterium]